MSSLMPFHPRFKWLLKTFGVHRQFVWLGAYGAPSRKGIFLWSMHPEVKELYRPLPNGFRGSGDLVIVDNNGGIAGAKGKLKESQTYPPAFGRAVAN
eukprot:1305539-Pyramimonas_sp.AAC.1